MRRFAQLYRELDETNRTSGKVAALESYFREAPPEDAAWALLFLSGGKAAKGLSGTVLRHLAIEETGLPSWLVEECHHAVGDLAETAALLLPGHEGESTPPLHRLVEERVLPLGMIPATARGSLILRTWRELGPQERYVYNKMITGALRVGVQQTLVVRALASVAGLPPALVAHRLMGQWRPTAEAYRALLAPADSGPAATDVARPYPFLLANQVDEPVEAIGDLDQWLVEWKWDGIRAQLIRRGGRVLLWSRGEELVTERFPEVAAAALEALPDGVVLDGELLAWEGDAPRPFARLQHRIGRKAPGAAVLAATPVAFVAYDLLESEGTDRRRLPLEDRRARLEALLAGAPGSLRTSPRVEAGEWSALRALRRESRARGVEGLMLKRRDGAYEAGRPRGLWWKWKIEPYTADCVLVHAQAGHGRRASLFTDYTFAVWDGDRLVPVMKAYSGLTDAEIREVDDWIRRHTTARHGPVRTVEPLRVFELGFEGIQASDRHRSGIAVRFPRILRMRPDKTPREADTLERMKALLRAAEGGG